MPVKRILDGLHQFQRDYFATHQELFEKLSRGQTPEILFITCCDSRIAPNLLTQTEPGELFIIRNLGNIIPPYSILNSSDAAGIEYAVCALNIKHIIVCGHSLCGSIKGLLNLESINRTMPLVSDWLKHYGEATRRILREKYPDYEGEELLKIATEVNVLMQIQNLETYPAIQAKLYTNELSIYAWVYQIETGEILAYNAKEAQFIPLTSEIFSVPEAPSLRQ